MKHPATSRWNVAKTSQWDISTTSYWNVMTMPQEDVTTTSHQCVSSTSQKSLKWNTQRRLSGTSPRRVSGTYLWRPISTSLRLLLKSQMKHLRCCNALLIGLYYIFKLLCVQSYFSSYLYFSIWWVFTSYLSIKSRSKMFYYQSGGKQEE